MANNEKRNAIIYINGVEVNNTLNSIQKHASTLRNEMAHLTRGTQEFNAKLKELTATNKILAQHRQQVIGINKSWEDVKMQLKGFGATMLAYLGGNALIGGFQNLIQKNVELSKAQTAVQRTTQLTNEQMELLKKNLSNRVTTTSLLNQLKLAEEAGKQGKDTVESVTEFVDEMDKAIIALGGDLGEAVIEQLGKLSTIFDTSSLKIGNAIKAIADSSIASAPYQVDFMMRTAGVANTVKIAADELMGYGATLENLGQSQEVSGTAINQFLLKLIQNTDEFGKIAGFADGELKKLIGEEGTNAGFIAFLQKLKETSTGTDDLVVRLNNLGLDGTRNAAVLLTLANNTELIAKQQTIAKEAIGNTSLVMDSFNKANSDFAANWTKFMKNVGAFFMNNRISQGFMSFIARLVDTRTEAKKAADAFNEQKTKAETLEKKLIPLRDRYTELKGKSQLNREEQIELNKVITELSSILPSAVAEWNKYGNAISISTAKINENIAAEKERTRLQNVDAIEQAYSDLEKLMFDVDVKVAELKSGVNSVMTTGSGLTSSTTPMSDAQRQKLMSDIDQAKGKIIDTYLLIENELGQTLSVTDQFNMQMYAMSSTGINLAASYFNQTADAAKNASSTIAESTKTIEEGINNLGDSTNVESAKKKMEDLSGAAEDIRQELFLLTADDKTKALAELDNFFEQLYIKAVKAGLTDTEIAVLYEVWTKQALELEEQFNATTSAALKLFGGDAGGGKIVDDNLVSAADQRRQSIEAETQATIELRKEREAYIETLYLAGASAIENAENEQDAIKGVINAIRDAIKQRIMEAIAGAVAKALVSVPFPLNIALGVAAGAGAQALFDQLVPQAADGGYYTDVVGRQTGMGYRAKVDQRFMGGYATQPMLVGEHAAEYTVPSYLMQNPYAVQMVDSLERMRTGQGDDRRDGGISIDLTRVIAKMDEMLKLMEQGKVVVMPDQTIQDFNKRLRMLEVLNLIPFI